MSIADFVSPLFSQIQLICKRIETSKYSMRPNATRRRRTLARLDWMRRSGHRRHVNTGLRPGFGNATNGCRLTESSVEAFFLNEFQLISFLWMSKYCTARFNGWFSSDRRETRLNFHEERRWKTAEYVVCQEWFARTEIHAASLTFDLFRQNNIITRTLRNNREDTTQEYLTNVSLLPLAPKSCLYPSQAIIMQAIKKCEA